VGEKVGTVPEVLNRLHKEHADLTRLLDLLDRQLALFTAGKSADYDTIGAILQYCMEYPDAVHHPKEDLVYGLLRGRDPVLAAEVGDLEEEHRGLAEMTLSLSALIERALAEEPVDREEVRKLTGDFIRRYRHHIAREELHVFPAALHVLSEDDWAKVDGQLGDKDDPLFGEVVTDYFQALRDDIDRLSVLAQGGADV
jgi:hemerythrin-like domain-containing protein